MKKKMPVKLADLVGEIQLQFDDTFTFINTQTGELISVTREELGAAEEDEPLENFPEWQRENIERAIQILEDEDDVYIDFTLREEYHEYEIMEDFIETIQDEEIQDELYGAIRGRGAFRRFKDGVREHGVDQDWYEYRDKKIEELVRKWCERHDILIAE